jgi:hypothetical protein
MEIVQIFRFIRLAKNIINFILIYGMLRGLGQRCRVVDSLGAERSGDRIPVGSRFRHLSRQALGSTHPPIQWVPGLFPGSKDAGAWR